MKFGIDKKELIPTLAGTSFIILSITSALSPVRMYILLSNKDVRSEQSLVNGLRF